MSEKRDSYHSLLEHRQTHFPQCLYHSYQTPITVTSSQGQYYNNGELLDLYNNVFQVGHQNQRVQKVLESSQINVGTRYLNQHIIDYAQALQRWLPKDDRGQSLYQLLFVNSGSEANDLALRIAMNYRKRKHLLSLTKSYHGTTYLCDQVSHLYSTGVPKPEVELGSTVTFLEPNANSLNDLIFFDWDSYAGVILECIQGVGGNTPLDPFFVKELVEKCREHDILMICDEVQTGFGRTGENFWAFEHYDMGGGRKLSPDLITCGKPIANGYPMGCLAIKRELTNYISPYYFNTFGGNSVACQIAQVVLEEIVDRKLMENSRVLGDYLAQQLQELPQVKKVTGRGLYLGVTFHSTVNPSYLVEWLKEKGVLVGLGHQDVLRIKPPLIVNHENIDQFLRLLKKFLVINFNNY